MRGLDTNVLVRYLTKDEPAQARRVNDLIDEAARRRERLFISTVVLCELVWTLKGRLYRYSRSEIAGAIEAILAPSLLLVQSRDQVRAALHDYRQGPGDFADYLIARECEAAGCRDTVTFDSRLRDSGLFAVLG